MKKIGFLSFGHWTPTPQSRTQSAADVLLQSIDLAVEAERLGMDGAYFRVHHFAQQLASPFPLLAAVGAKTRRIEIGTAVIDMRYENPHYMVEDAGAADLIAGGRLQLGISRGSPEQVIDGWRYLTRVQCFRIRRGFCVLSHTLRDCVIGSGGGPLLMRQLHGPRNEE
jgi:alkanesulfonate monooxygenase SsuD/methylene tetrahydromethanopterin reductase-like flavin-dependent oxidoreductase (luciferase family)